MTYLRLLVVCALTLVLLPHSGAAVPIQGQISIPTSIQRQATDCTTQTGGSTGEICEDTDDNVFYVCETGPCNAAGWEQYGGVGGGGGGGDVTDVGDCNTGACFTDDGTGNVVTFEGATADAFETKLTTEDPTVDVTVTLPTDPLETSVEVDYEEWDVILRDPSCDEIQRAINPYLDEDVPGDATRRRIKISGELNGDSILNESDITGRNLSGDTAYNLCVAIVPTSTFTSNFPDSDATTRIGIGERPLHIHWDNFRAEMDSTGTTKPMVFLQIGDTYHHGRTSATTDAPEEGAQVRYLKMTGNLNVRMDPDAAHRTWPAGKVPRFPLNPATGTFTANSMIGLFVNGMFNSDLSDLQYTANCTNPFGLNIPWVKTAGWSNEYPHMQIGNCAIGTWWMENSIGRWGSSFLSGNGINVLFGTQYGGSTPLELVDNSTCTSANAPAGCCTGSGTGTCAPVTDFGAGGVVMLGVQSNEALASGYVVVQGGMWGRGLRTERGTSGAPWDDEQVGDSILIGAGFCDANSDDAQRNRISGQTDLEDMVCSSDEQCNNVIDGTGTGTCATTDITGTAHIAQVDMEFVSAAGTSLSSVYSTVALGPNAIPDVTGGEDFTGAHVRITGEVSGTDNDRTIPGNWTTSGAINDLGTGNCPAVTNTECWVADLTNNATGQSCNAGNDAGAPDFTDPDAWGLCEYNGSAWLVVAGRTCSEPQSNLDCAILYANSAATVNVDVSGIVGGTFYWEDTSTTQYANIVASPQDETICRYHATDCTLNEGCTAGTICHEQDADTYFVCDPSTGSVCEQAGDWTATTVDNIDLESVTVTNIADDEVPLGDAAGSLVYTAIPDCTDAGGGSLNYTAATNTFSCGADAGAGGGMTSWTLADDDGTTGAVSDAEEVEFKTDLAHNTEYAADGSNHDLTISYVYSNTLAADPGLNAEECVFTTDGSSSAGALLCEGSVADGFEGLFTLPDVTGADDTQVILTDSTAPAGDATGTFGALDVTDADCIDADDDGTCEVALSGTTINLDPDDDGTAEVTISSIGEIATADNEATGDNRIRIGDHDTAVTPDPTCANKGLANNLTIVDKDETANDDWVICNGTTEEFDFGLGIESGDAAGGDLTGTYPNPTVAANAVALATDTTGNYIATVTAGTGIDITSGSPSEAATPTFAVGASVILESDVGDGLTVATNTLHTDSSDSGFLEELSTNPGNDGALIIDTDGDATNITSPVLGFQSGGTDYFLCPFTSYPSTDGFVLRFDTATNTCIWEADATGGTINSYETWATPAGANPVAVAATDTITFTQGIGLTITGANGGAGADTIDFSLDLSQTLAGNPGFAVDECALVATASGGGFICEGSAANLNEQLYLLPDVDGADTTNYIATHSASVTSLIGSGLVVSGTTLTVESNEAGFLDTDTTGPSGTGAMRIDTDGNASTIQNDVLIFEAAGAEDFILLAAREYPVTGGDIFIFDATNQDWDWVQLSGDVTMSETGAVTIAASAVELDSMVTNTLPVANGGTGATTLTDGGILLGSGTGAVTALGVATNGQIPIGDGTTDPVLATITGTASEIDVTNGTGSITLDLSDTINLSAKTSLELVNATSPSLGNEGEIAVDTTSAGIEAAQLIYHDGGAVRVVPAVQTHCVIIEDLAAADDDKPFWMNSAYTQATAISASCRCIGTCTTEADISFENDDGTVADITGSVDCEDTATAETNTALSGAEATIDQYETIRFDVDNAVSPETDDYIICLNYEVTRQ